MSLLANFEGFLTCDRLEIARRRAVAVLDGDWPSMGPQKWRARLQIGADGRTLSALAATEVAYPRHFANLNRATRSYLARFERAIKKLLLFCKNLVVPNS